MTIEQQRLEDIAYTETRVREEMQQYVDAANNRADKAEQKAICAKQETAIVKQEASAAKQEAAAAKRQNIANIIGICRSCDFSDDQIIKQLIERAHLTYDEACKALTEY